MPRSGAGRDVVAVLGTFLVLGVLGGLVWVLMVTPAELTKLGDSGGMAEDQLGKQFAADGWYVLISGVAGVAAGLGLSWWRSRDPLLTSGLLLVGSVVAAATMAWTGHLLGPGDPGTVLRGADTGTRAPEQLGVGTFSVYLAWPVAVLAGALFVLLGRVPDDGS